MYRILVVEDDEVIAKTIRQHLQSWNYEVFAVADFNSVMEEFARVKPHLVLMDIRLPFHNIMVITGAQRSGKFRSCQSYLSLR